MESSLNLKIKEVANNLKSVPNEKEILIISHFDTDGITSATIMIQALKKLDKKFSVKIIKNLDKEFINNLPKNKVILFLDLGSGNINAIQNAELEKVFIIDHHEIQKEIPESIEIINPHLNENQKISAAGLVYLFCKELNSENKEFAKLAILGMIGDRHEKEIGKLNNGILEDSEVQRRKGILIYPSTRPLNRTLEYCSNPFIPEITGNPEGVTELLREINLTPKNGKYPNLLELNKEEMKKLVTAITLRVPEKFHDDIIGEIFLVKMFNKSEDARELSAMINSCSRMGEPNTALNFCLEIPKAKKRAEEINIKYKQELISALKFVKEREHLETENYVLINAQNNIKETIIGTIGSMIASSTMYSQGKVIITMAYFEDKIKISLRKSGSENLRNLKELICQTVENLNAEVGGHAQAAGATILQSQEEEFLNNIGKIFEYEVIKV